MPDQSLADVFPSFVWILRDFALELRDSSGAEMSQNDYLEDALKEKI